MTDVDQLMMESSTIEMDGSSKFSNQLHETAFTIFEHVSSLGYFSWDPKNSSYQPLNEIKSSEEILCHIDCDGKPDHLKAVETLNKPKTFERLPVKEIVNMFPFGQNDIASLHIAVKRGVDFKGLDFAFGGSALEMLASQDTDSRFIATRVPGTECILVVKSKVYTNNVSGIAFQFKRYVTDHDMSYNPSCEQVEHIHVGKVGGNNVLFHADVDAIDSDGTPVKARVFDRRFMGTSAMFQMISSGSALLCHGEKSRGVLSGVALKSLSEVAGDALASSRINVKELESNILDGMESLKNQIKDDNIYKISFLNGVLHLCPGNTSISTVLPNTDIVKDLIN